MSLNNIFNTNILDINKSLQNIEDNIKRINDEVYNSLFFNDFNGFEIAKKSIESVETSINSLDNSIKNIKIKDFSNDIKNSLSSISNIYRDLSSSFSNFFNYDLSSYDNLLEEAKNKLQQFDDFQNKLRDDNNKANEEDYENYLNRLDEELELSIKNKDYISAHAISIKQKELKKKQEKENEDLQKENEIKTQRELLEKELAQAEYNRDYANWDNQVKLAEMEKSKALADAVLIPSLAIAQSALGVASSFAQGGPAGFAAGLIISASTISAAISAASAIVSSSNALDSLKSNPPKTPQFAFGTTGYIIPDGGSAIVGEMGAELISNKSGKISVQSNAQLNEFGYNRGDIWNITLNVKQALNADEIYKLMNNYKLRNSQKYTR